MKARNCICVAAFTLLALPLAAQSPADPAVGALADRVFSQFTSTTPGCIIGVAREGHVLLERAYGAADLELGVPLTAGSILEAGSVSKQFTAAAVTLLALEGKLRFDDPVQKHFPELPQYERAITIRMLLDHTSGLRDWGDIVSIGGWPRGSRAYTHAHVLDIIARQRAVNYAPGSAYSYTNSGYSLLAMLVARVSGKSFAEFTRERLFAPLGMTQTSWRDDFRRIVPGRAPAYAPVGSVMGMWQLDMPFENTHGHGGLLTTVGDLLKWNEALTKRTLGAALVDSLTRRGVLTDGNSITYAAGLVVDQYRGTPQIAHSGATAGYRSYLARYPAQRDLSVVVLCNTAAPSVQLAHQVVDGLASELAEPVRGMSGPVTAPVAQPAPESLRDFTGSYASDEVGITIRVDLVDGRLVVRRGPGDVARLGAIAGENRFAAGGGVTIWFTKSGAGDAPTLHVGTGRAHDVVFARVK